MAHGPSQRYSTVGVYCHFGFPSNECGFRYGVPEKRDSRGFCQRGGQSLRRRDREVYGAHNPLVVQKGGLDRHYVFRLARDAHGVPLSEMVNT